MTSGLSRRRWLCGAAAAAALGAGVGRVRAAASPQALAQLRQSSRLTVAIYKDMPPFNVDGRGIDIDLGNALAERLGVKPMLLPFQADENLNDDLRNMVWRGHYLGHGPADVMLHVPVDRPLIDATPQVDIFAPYWRERVVVARDLEQVPTMESLDAFAGKRIAVPGQTLAGWLLIGADNGKYREQLLTKWKDGVDAARALRRGEVAAAAGLLSELQSELGGEPRYRIEPLPVPRAKDGWAVGMAVKRDSAELAKALQQAVNELADSGALAQIFERANLTWRRP